MVGAEAEGLVADYKKSPEEVYAWISRHLYRHQKCSAADIWGNVNLMNWDAWSSQPLQDVLPSWAPDWDNTGPTLRRIFAYENNRIGSYLTDIPLQFDNNDKRAMCLQGYFFVNFQQLLSCRVLAYSTKGLRIDWLVHDRKEIPHQAHTLGMCSCPVCSALTPKAMVIQVTTKTITHPSGIVSCSDFRRIAMLLYPMDADSVSTGLQPAHGNERFRVWCEAEEAVRT